MSGAPTAPNVPLVPAQSTPWDGVGLESTAARRGRGEAAFQGVPRDALVLTILAGDGKCPECGRKHYLSATSKKAETARGNAQSIRPLHFTGDMISPNDQSREVATGIAHAHGVLGNNDEALSGLPLSRRQP